MAPVNGTLYVNSEVEPFVAANPANAANLIGVWQQDRWSNGGARGHLSASSFDGGRTWSTSMAAFSRCTGGTPANGGDYERASDPWVTIGPDGIAYQIAIVFSGQTSAAGSSNAVLVSRSVDGGRSWSGPVTVIRDGADNFNDKESVTADPARRRLCVRGVGPARGAGHGPTYLSRTTDGGASWEVARMIYDPGATSQTINNQVVVTTDGTLVVFFTRLDPAAGGMATATLVVIRSADKGATWSTPIVVSPVQVGRRPRSGDRRFRARRLEPGLDRRGAGQHARRGVAGRTLLGRRARRRRALALDRRWPYVVDAGSREPRCVGSRVRAGGERAERRHDRHLVLRLPQQHAVALDTPDRHVDRTLE